MMPLYFLLVMFCQICQVAAADNASGISQDSGVITAKVGQNVTLQCFYQDDAVTFLSWYQQSLGGKPLIISTRMEHNTEASIYPAYKERFRVLAQAQEAINHLVITDLRLSDSATYYCGILEFNALEFEKGVFLHVNTSASNIHAVVQQPVMESYQLGDSVNLNCAAYAEPCAGEQSLYWFRHGVSQPALMYRGAGQCMKDSGSHMKNCTLTLALKSVSSSDAGMYYCALASCGEIVFGNGSRVEIIGSTKDPSFLVYCLTVALAGSIIMLLVLAFILYTLKKQSCPVCRGPVSHPACSADSDAVSQDEDILHYAALSMSRPSEQHRQEESACVYARVMRKE